LDTLSHQIIALDSWWVLAFTLVLYLWASIEQLKNQISGLLVVFPKCHHTFSNFTSC
jgi:hypothetical protein